MSTDHFYLKNGLIIAGGLCIGLLARAALMPESQTTSNTSSKSERITKVAAPHTDRDTSSSVIHLIELDGRVGSKRTLEEEITLKSALFDLDSGDYPTIAKAFAQRNSPADKWLIATLFVAWGHQAPQAALQTAETMPHFVESYIESWILEGWVLSDAKAAFDHVSQENPLLPPGKISVIERLPDKFLWGRLASEAPAQALALASEIIDPERRHQIEEEVIRIIGYRDSEGSLEWALTHRDGDDLHAMVEKLVNSWTGYQRPQQVLRQVLELPEELQTGEIYKKFGNSLGQRPEEAIEMIDEIPEAHFQNFLGGLIRGAATYNPSHAAQIAQDLPQGKVKQQAYYELGSSWSEQDPVAATEWLSTLPRSLSRDRAIRGFAWGIGKDNPKLAVTWLIDMDHRGYRDTGLHNSLYYWLERDPTEAQAWMDAQPEERLSTAEKERVMRSFTE